MADVSIRNVVKRYGELEVIHGVSLDVQAGEFVVFVGPSGCGKSTLLRMIAGLESFQSGTISIADKVVNGLPARDRDIAMVFQEYALYPHMTVAANMGFGLKMRSHPRSEIADRVKSAAQILQIDHLMQRRPRELSGGQRQRVAMGRAIVRDPRVFLFDEPLSNLDAKLRIDMRSEIKRLHQRLGATMIYVTHDQVEAMTMADRIVVLNGGHIEQVGTPQELYRHPATRFVAGFIGSPSMNFLDFHVDGEDLRHASGLVLKGFGRRIRGANVVVGIRPEDLYAEVGQGSGEVEIVEPLGADTQVTVRLATDSLVVRMPGESLVKVGDRTDLRLREDRVLLFDPAEGTRIDVGAR